MRSVFVHLRDATEQALSDFLGQISSPGRGPRWVVAVNSDPFLYVDFYNDAHQEFEADDWSALIEALGGEPTISLIVDVSGRHSGDQQVRKLVSSVLSQFDGVAQDEYTKHCWTRQEIVSGHEEEGHPFFDYLGWHKENGYLDGP